MTSIGTKEKNAEILRTLHNLSIRFSYNSHTFNAFGLPNSYFAFVEFCANMSSTMDKQNPQSVHGTAEHRKYGAFQNELYRGRYFENYSKSR